MTSWGGAVCVCGGGGDTTGHVDGRQSVRPTKAYDAFCSATKSRLGRRIAESHRKSPGRERARHRLHLELPGGRSRIVSGRACACVVVVVTTITIVTTNKSELVLLARDGGFIPHEKVEVR